MDYTENWYRILGVPEHASEEEIRRAYRKLAKQYHPDAHPGDTSCEKKFREINEAYHVLSDKERRSQYDAGRGTETAAKETQRRADRRTEQHTQTSGVDFENIHKTFEQFFGFNPDTKNVTNQEKLNPKKKNPLDTTDLFERFMGIKR